MFRNNYAVASKKLVIDLTPPQQKKLAAKLKELTDKEWKFTDAMLIEGRNRAAFTLEVPSLDPLEAERINWQKSASQHGFHFNVDFMKTSKGRTDYAKRLYICHTIELKKIFEAKREDIFPVLKTAECEKPKI